MIISSRWSLLLLLLLLLLGLMTSIAIVRRSGGTATLTSYHNEAVGTDVADDDECRQC